MIGSLGAPLRRLSRSGGTLDRRQLLTAFVTLAGTRAVAQGGRLLAGLLVLRILTVEEYGIYTIFGSVLGFAAVLANPGLSQAMIHFANTPQHRDAFTHEFSIVVRLARLSMAGAVVLAAVYWIGVTWSDVDSNVEIVIGMISLFILAAIQNRVSLCQGLFYAQQNVAASAGTELTGSVIRLVLLAALYAMAWQVSWLAVVLCSILAAASQTWVSSYYGTPPIERSASWDLRRYMQFVAPMLPGKLLFAVKGLVGVSAIAIVADTRLLGEFGALGRMAQIMGLLQFVNMFFVLPYLSRLDDQPRQRREALRIIGVIGATTMAVAAIAFLAPEPAIMLIGDRYRHLSALVWIGVLAGGCSVLAGTISAALMATGDTRLQSVPIGLALAAQFLYVIAVPPAGIEEAAVLLLVAPGVMCVAFLCVWLVTMRRRRLSTAAAS